MNRNWFVYGILALAIFVYLISTSLAGHADCNNPTYGENTTNVHSIYFTGVALDVADERSIENEKPIENSVAKLKTLNGFSYTLKNDPGQATEYGVSAQDVQKVFPELVSVVDKDNGTLGVNYNGLIAPLIEAMKEQQAQIEALRSEIETLKAERDNKISNKPGEL